MLKIKYLLPVFAVVLLFGLSNSAFAQVSCGTASTPVSRDTLTGLTEPAGDITFNCVQAGPAATTAATITVDYQGAPITNSTTYPVGKVIGITGGAAPCTAVPTIGAVSNATGQIVINVPAEGPGIAGTCSFTLTGVLFGLSGTGKTSVVATLSVSPGNNLTLTSGQTTPTVVTSVLDGVCPGASGCAPGGVAAGAAAIFTTAGGAIGTGTNTITVKENYIDFFRAAAQFNSGFSTQGVQLLFTFTGLPTGSTMTCAGTMAAAGGGATGTVTPIAPATGIVPAATPTLIVEATGTPNLSAIDTVSEACTFAPGTATLPLPPGTITATVSLAPGGAAFCTAGAVCTAATTGQIPRYTTVNLGPVTVTNIIAATTNMLFPFVSLSTAYDSGFSIANTTADPYGAPTAAGTGGARPQTGVVTLAFYPAAGSTAPAATAPFCIQSGAGGVGVAGLTCTTLDLTKSTFSGGGLGAGGVLAPGSSWSFLMSDLMKSTGAGSAFNGYAFGITGFSNSHATSFVCDPSFTKFCVGGTALIVANPAIVGRNAVGTAGGGEILGH